MIHLALLAQAVPSAGPPLPPPSSAAAPMTLARCAGLVRAAPADAIAAANRWVVDRGGIDARLCLAQAYVAGERWAAAATAFTQAADDATRAGDERAAHLRVQAGNSWLAADNAASAIAALDAALALATMSEGLRGEALIDRARAHVAAGDLKAARIDLDRGIALVPEDPFAWYASASLAAREGDLVRARKEIAKAAVLAPDDAGIKTLSRSLAEPSATAAVEAPAR